MNKITETLLLDCQNGNRKAQSALYKMCFSLLMGVCMRYKKNESEAVASLNVGFLKIITNLEKYNRSIPFVAWAKRIMINTLIDDFRKNKKEKEHVQYTDFESFEGYQEPIDFNLAEQIFDVEQLEQMIRSLPPMTGKVFNLYGIDGYSHKEVGKMLDISEGTSKWHLSAARQKLKQLIKENMDTGYKTVHKRLSNG